ncbi:hypothetical protein HN371_07930 [Candidatus Poribacteria bacterium]|jgi:hypothetical protein|nr:hypothetical protein [Candidatus Poribacteria bacterium]MBT5534877.1 hypothetical protein [Candidatus Poribacteria bacterium]MBT5710310.1 hypothetical protein [Candidatus Poribacteria bacterium]MBT7095725.1 hypothetical protein [Candidatus Poribacteria bacterium]MBT7804831.1 hypothetical protein [Candidatus Poribacteria bacterium]
MGVFEFVVAIVALVLGSAVGITWACVWHGVKMQSLATGASDEGLEATRRDIDALRDDVRDVQEALADVTLALADSSGRPLPPSDTPD